MADQFYLEIPLWWSVFPDDQIVDDLGLCRVHRDRCLDALSQNSATRSGYNEEVVMLQMRSDCREMDLWHPSAPVGIVEEKAGVGVVDDVLRGCRGVGPDVKIGRC